VAQTTVVRTTTGWKTLRLITARRVRDFCGGTAGGLLTTPGPAPPAQVVDWQTSAS
jgi:hypothetical protein